MGRGMSQAQERSVLNHGRLEGSLVSQYEIIYDFSKRSFITEKRKSRLQRTEERMVSEED